eukprot:3420864-Pleurochrysis_carterae.AAC.1
MNPQLREREDRELRMDVDPARLWRGRAPRRPRMRRVYVDPFDLRGGRHLVGERHPREIVD